MAFSFKFWPVVRVVYNRQRVMMARIHLIDLETISEISRAYTIHMGQKKIFDPIIHQIYVIHFRGDFPYSAFIDT